ncbi:OLC1v1013846C1 [Oldenlandia corymbosa var. corymbosa]|uniref:OLC1v1013846C1 n=1 Tax=Oldenlandia corymbosa var. corymbosa TaxID=529605 RepID=A0AAV1DZC7_OLDCO|nr:OLC1v1013846C1 [Oldenlandia corymbosa var. corymbosa]
MAAEKQVQEKLEFQIPEIVLNSGHKMPAVGMGGVAEKLPPVEELTSILVHAMEIGYRHFDTAACYGSEEALGKAVAKALEIGVIQNRDELFITSKLWITHTHHDLVLPALNKTLETMGLEYLDLYLIHWPVRIKEGANMFNLAESEVLPFDIHGTWKAMEDCSKSGLTKSIGLSNFSCEKISQLLENATIPPAVNQVEMNVNWQQRKLLPFCKERGIHVCGWSPLGGYGTFWGSNAVMESQILKDIANSKSKTISQVALRWVNEQGVTPIVKSFNEERMKQNLQIFDWELSTEENDRILQIPQRRVGSGDVFIVKNGPIKSVEELWDGDT